MKVGFQENDENSVRSLSISQHGNFPSPPAPVADLSSALTFPLKPQDPSLPFPLPETNNNNKRSPTIFSTMKYIQTMAAKPHDV